MLFTTGVVFALAGAADLAVALMAHVIPASLGATVRTHLLPTALLAAGLLALYKVIPRRRATWSSALVGAVVGAGLLRIAQAGFTAYLTTLANFESAYGPIAGLAVLMTWALVASAIILFGAHLVAVLNGADRGGGERCRRPTGPGDPDHGYEPPPQHRDRDRQCHEVARTRARSSSRTTK